jgi:hypothetical protein
MLFKIRDGRVELPNAKKEENKSNAIKKCISFVFTFSLIQRNKKRRVRKINDIP